MDAIVSLSNIKNIDVAAGMWIRVNGEGDYHCYISKEGLVMGHNSEGLLQGHTDCEWSDPAISFTEGKVEVQFTDDNKCVTNEVPVHQFVKLYKKFLSDVVELSK